MTFEILQKNTISIVMEDPKKVEIFYNTTDTFPSKRLLVVLSIQQLLVFLPLVIMPVMFLINVSSQPDTLYHWLSLAMLGCAFSTLLISRHGVLGGNCYLPVTFATPMFALLLMLASAGKVAAFFNACVITGVMAGLFQLCLTPFIRWAKMIFNIHLAGFITMLLGIWVAQMGIIALFYPDNLAPLLFHRGQQSSQVFDLKQVSIGFFSLAITFGCRLSTKKNRRMFCLMYGSIAGWITAFLTGNLSETKVAMVVASPWFKWPSFNDIHFVSFNSNLIIPTIIASVILTMQLFSVIAMLQHDSSGESNSLHFVKRNARVNIAASLGLIVSSILGMPQAPNPAGFGVLACTGVFSKKIAYGVSLFICLLAFFPKILMCFLTIPASVHGAMILFVGSAMFIHSLSVIKLKDLNRLHLLICILSLLIGTSITIEPIFYDSTHFWLSSVTNPMIFIALIIFVLSQLIFFKIKRN